MQVRRGLIVCVAWLLPLAARGADCDSLESLRWLLGDWLADGSKSTFHESWRELGVRDFLGTGIERAKPGGTLKGGEELRLVRMGGAVFYVSKVTHNELPVAFRMTSCSDGVFTFENPAHDFPKRLEYRQIGDEALAVRVSDGGSKGFTLEFMRAGIAPAPGGGPLAAEDARFQAMIAADRAGMSRWFDEELEYVHSTGIVEGREGLIDSLASGRVRYLAVEPVERQVALLAPDVALVHGTGKFRVFAGGQSAELMLHYTAVYVQRGGDWRLRSWQSLQIPRRRSES
jgi:hypothetical protein